MSLPLPVLPAHRPAHAILEPPAHSRDAFSVASIELYSRLWHALEQVTDRPLDTENFSAAGLHATLVRFRLELLVLLDACESLRWRSLLHAQDRIQLKATLNRLLHILSDHADDRFSVLPQAQDFLLDAVLAECSCCRQGVQSKVHAWQRV